MNRNETHSSQFHGFPPNLVQGLDKPFPELMDERNLVQRFQEDVRKNGLVGEEDNAATVLLCAISAKLDRPLNVTVVGASSAGKNHLLANVAAFIPDEDKKVITGMTPKALMHAGETEFQHKAVFIAEYEGVAKADYAIRTMQSEQMIEWDFVDTKKGIEKKTRKVKGPTAFLQATTRSVLHPENETRLLFIRMDESADLTKEILLRQARHAATKASGQSEDLTESWKQLIRSLEMNTVVIPFAVQLAAHFPFEKVRSRRDFPKLLGLIETSAFLHQHQREKKDGAVVATAEDYEIAKTLFEHCYSTGPDQLVEELLKAAEAVSKQEGNFCAGHLIEKTGWGKTKTYEVLARAEELGCIAETESRGVYRFVRNSAVPPLTLPEAI